MSKDTDKKDEKSPTQTSFGESAERPAYLEPTFTKMHLAISHDDFEAQKDVDHLPILEKLAQRHPQLYQDHYEKLKARDHKGYLPLASNQNARMEVSLVVNPTYEDMIHYLKSVGGAYGWHLRKKYQNREAVEDFLADRDTSIYVFSVNDEKVGMCIVAGIDPKVPTKPGRGVNKTAAVNIFAGQKVKAAKDAGKPLPSSMNKTSPRMIEIYKFGMFESSTGYGFGHFFLPKMFAELMEHRGYDGVYLDTRDTNPAPVCRFYEKNGMTVFHQEELPSDIDLGAVTRKIEPANPVQTMPIDTDEPANQNIEPDKAAPKDNGDAPPAP